MSAREYDINGWMEIEDNPISKVGVFPYRGSMIDPTGELGLSPNEIYNVYRPASELSSQDTIDSFKLQPWIDDHEILGNDDPALTPPERKGIQGVIGEKVYFKDDYLYANIKAFAGDLQTKIDDGKSELSCGYRCEYTLESGIYGDQSYDAVQRNIRGNHLASVDEGRMGPEVAVLDHFTFDSKDFKPMAKIALTFDALRARTKLSPKVAAALKIVTDAMHEGEDEDDPMKGEDGDDPEKGEDGDDPEKGEDADEPEKGEDGDDPMKGEDEDDRDKGEDSKNLPEGAGTDAVDIKSLRSEVRDLRRNGVKTILAEMHTRDALVAKVSPTIGTFDHSEMTAEDVAVYACGKLGLKPTKGHEQTALDAYFTNRRPPVGFGADGAVPLAAGDSSHIDDYFEGTK